jgi:hypothetical protein
MNVNFMDTTSVDGSSNWMGLLIARHFTKHEYGDKLPPTYRAEMDLPIVKQTRAMIAFQILQELAAAEQRKMMSGSQKQARKYLKALAAQQR